MTYSIFSIDASTLSVAGCASYTYLLAASQPYSRAPFYQSVFVCLTSSLGFFLTWSAFRFSEQTSDIYASNGGTNPAFTFLTGHGGFLQYAFPSDPVPVSYGLLSFSSPGR